MIRPSIGSVSVATAQSCPEKLLDYVRAFSEKRYVSSRGLRFTNGFSTIQTVFGQLALEYSILASVGTLGTPVSSRASVITAQCFPVREGLICSVADTIKPYLLSARTNRVPRRTRLGKERGYADQ